MSGMVLLSSSVGFAMAFVLALVALALTVKPLPQYHWLSTVIAIGSWASAFGVFAWYVLGLAGWLVAVIVVATLICCYRWYGMGTGVVSGVPTNPSGESTVLAREGAELRARVRKDDEFRLNRDARAWG